MKKFMAITTCTIILSGCVIHKTVNPVTDHEITELCIEQNKDVFMEGFHPELVTQIETMGIKTHTYETQRPKSCTFFLEYTANWAWDLAMYLVYADIRVYDSNQLIGKAEYNARSGGGRLDKFGTTAEKIRPLLSQLFRKNQY